MLAMGVHDEWDDYGASPHVLGVADSPAITLQRFCAFDSVFALVPANLYTAVTLACS